MQISFDDFATIIKTSRAVGKVIGDYLYQCRISVNKKTKVVWIGYINEEGEISDDWSGFDNAYKYELSDDGTILITSGVPYYDGYSDEPKKIQFILKLLDFENLPHKFLLHH